MEEENVNLEQQLAEEVIRSKKSQEEAEPGAKTELKAVAQPTEEEEFAPIVKQTHPKSFQIMRTLSNRYSLIQGELFEKALSKSSRKFTEDTLCAFCLAVAQKLYNDSYSTGRAREMNIGRAKREGDKVIIDITLKEIEEYGYGIDLNNNKHRAEIVELINFIHSTPIPVLDSEGTGKGKYLVNVEEWSIEKHKTQAVKLRIDKVFCSRIEGYGKFPQDIMKRLVADSGRVTSIDRRLLLHLGSQNQEQTHTDHIENIALKVGRMEEYRHDKKRFITALISVLLRFKRVGVITDYRIFKNGSIVFYFKPSQIEDKKE